MRMVNISNEKSMQSYTARCSRYKNKYTNLVCGKTAVGRNYNLPRDSMWWNDRYKPYVSMIIDLILDAVLINIIGIKGAIISSIVCIQCHLDKHFVC